MSNNSFTEIRTKEEYDEYFRDYNHEIAIEVREKCKFINGILYDEKNNKIYKDRLDFMNEYNFESQDDIKYIDKKIFIMDYSWGWNYHNMYYECLPQILIYKKLLKSNQDLYISIPLNFIDIFKHIFLILNLDIDMIIKESNFQCNTCMFTNFGKLYFLSHISLNMHPYHYEINNLLKDNLSMHSNVEDNKLLYLSRKDTGVGKNRHIINKSEINNFIIENNGKIVQLEDKTLQDKYNIISNNEIIVTMVGANLVNLYFSDLSKTKKIILLAPDTSSFYNTASTYVAFNIYFLKKYTKVEDIKIIYGKVERTYSEAHGEIMNQPFKINIQDIQNEI